MSYLPCLETRTLCALLLPQATIVFINLTPFCWLCSDPHALFPPGGLGGIPQQPGGDLPIDSITGATEDLLQAAGEESPATKKGKNKKRLTKQSITELEKLQPGLVSKLVEIVGADRLAYYVFPEDLKGSSDKTSPADDKPKLSLKNIAKPRDTDVLCGGSNKQYDIHPGNSNFNQVISMLRGGIYQNAKGKDERMKISGAIVASIRANQGRFIEKSSKHIDDATKVSNWVDIGDKKATKMVYDAFRKESSGTSNTETSITSMPTTSPRAMQVNVGVAPTPDHSLVSGHMGGSHHLMLPGMGRAFGVGGPAALGMNYLAGAAMHHLPHIRRGVGGIPPMIPPANPAGNGMYKSPCKCACRENCPSMYTFQPSAVLTLICLTVDLFPSLLFTQSTTQACLYHQQVLQWRDQRDEETSTRVQPRMISMECRDCH